MTTQHQLGWTAVGVFALALACGETSGGDEAAVDTGSGEDDTSNPADSSGETGGTDTGDLTDTSSGAAESSGGADESTGAAVCETDVCATYGAAVPAVASDIVDAAATDPMFMEDFAPLVAQGADAVQAFKDSLANFISDAYGCTDGAYTGPSMEDAHAGMNITQEEYDAFIGLIAGVLADAGVPDEDINLCFAPPLVDPAFANTIIGQ